MAAAIPNCRLSRLLLWDIRSTPGLYTGNLGASFSDLYRNPHIREGASEEALPPQQQERQTDSTATQQAGEQCAVWHLIAAPQQRATQATHSKM